MSCNFPNSWQGPTPGLPRRRLKIPIVCLGCMVYYNSAYAYFVSCRRGMSTQPPAEKASEIINKLPSSPNLVTKTGTVILGSGLVATAISQELYVMNEETVIAVGFFLLLGFIAKVCFELCHRDLIIVLMFKSYFSPSASPTATGLKPRLPKLRQSSTVLAPNTLMLSRTESTLLSR